MNIQELEKKLRKAFVNLRSEDLKTLIKENPEESKKALSGKLGTEVLESLILSRTESGYTTLDVLKDGEMSDPSVRKISTALGWLANRPTMPNLDKNAKVADCCEILFENGLIPDSENAIMAMRFGERKILEKMIEHGFNVTQHEITESGCEKDCQSNILDLLIEKQMYDVDAVIDGFPRICMATFSFNPDLTKYLIDHGADLQVTVQAEFNAIAEPSGDSEVDNQTQKFYEQNVQGKGPLELSYATKHMPGFQDNLKHAMDPKRIVEDIEKTHQLLENAINKNLPTHGK